MARTALTATLLTANAGVAAVSQAVDVTNGHSIAFPSGTLGQNKGQSRALVIRVANTAGADKIVTIKANAGPTAGTDYYAPFHDQAGRGDLAVTVAATSGVQYITNLDSSRFLQNDGTVWVDYASAMTGTIEVYCTSLPSS